MAETVIVACKLPHGIILEVGKEKVELKGSMHLGRPQTPFYMASQIVGLTKVSRDFWEAWVKQHENFVPYQKGFIFAADKKKKVLDEAKEKETLMHGLEPIDSAKMPKSLEQVKAGQAI